MKKILQNVGLVGATASTFLWAVAAHAQTGSSGDFPPVTPLTGSFTISDLVGIIGNVVNALLAIAGALAVVYLIYAGIIYITGGAKGDADAKKMIINAITGVVVIVLSYVLVSAAISLVKGTGL